MYEDMQETPHREMCDFYEMDYPKKLLVGSRGIYKTSIGTIGKAIQLILQDPNNLILLVMNNQKNAEAKVREIKNMFDRNPRLREVAKDIIPPEGRKDGPWSREALQFVRTSTAGEPNIVAAGVEVDLASTHFNWILGDDIVSASKHDIREDGWIILRPEDVEKAIGWYKLTMKGLAINKPGQVTNAQFTVNRWGVHDFARHVMDHHLKCEDNPTGFEFLEMGVHREDGSLLWPKVFTEDRLAEIHRDVGDFIYYTQYECIPRDPQNRGFPVECNTYWEGNYPPGYEENMHLYKIYCLIDLADANKPSSCNTSIVILWVDQFNHIWVGEAVRAKMDTNRKIEVIHDMVRKYNLNDVHIEENLHKDTLKYVLSDAMKKANIFYRQRPLTHKLRSKDGRIMRLQPHHKNGALHIKRTHTALLQELRDFGFTHLKDIVDALGYIMDFIRGPIIRREEELPLYDPSVVTLQEIKRSIDDVKVASYGGGNRLFKKQGRVTASKVFAEQMRTPA
jgi:hypothetical protein